MCVCACVYGVKEAKPCAMHSTHIETGRQTHKHRHTQTHTDTHRHTHRHTQTHTDTHLRRSASCASAVRSSWSMSPDGHSRAMRSLHSAPQQQCKSGPTHETRSNSWKEAKVVELGAGRQWNGQTLLFALQCLHGLLDCAVPGVALRQIVHRTISAPHFLLRLLLVLPCKAKAGKKQRMCGRSFVCECVRARVCLCYAQEACNLHSLNGTLNAGEVLVWRQFVARCILQLLLALQPAAKKGGTHAQPHAQAQSMMRSTGEGGGFSAKAQACNSIVVAQSI